MRLSSICLLTVVGFSLSAIPHITSAQQEDPYRTIYLNDLTETPASQPTPQPRTEQPLLRGDLFPALRLTPPDPQTDVEPSVPTTTQRRTSLNASTAQPLPASRDQAPTDAQIRQEPDGELVSTAVVGTSEDEDFGPGRFADIPFSFNVTLREGYDDNVLLSRNRIGSWFTEFGIDTFYEASDPRFSLELGAFVDLIWFYNRPGNDLDWNSGFDVDASYRVTPRLTLTGNVSLAFRQEPDLTLVGGNSRDVGSYLTTNASLVADYVWTERFSTRSSYSFSSINYETQAAANQQDRITNTIANEFRYLVQPTITAVLEYRFSYITYFTALRDNYNNFILAGGDFQIASRLGATFRGGVEIREYTSSAGGGGEVSPYFQSSVTYEYLPESAVTWTLRYGLEESDVFNRRNRETLRTGFAVDHAFTPRISAALGFYYVHDDYASVGTSQAFTDNSFDVTTAVRYSINRNWAVEATYIHTEFLSGLSIQNYARNRVSLGGVFSF